MGHIFGTAIAIICLISGAFGSGKEPQAPRLSPAVLAALKSTTPAPALVEPLSPTILTCLPDYELRDGQCVKTIAEPADLACRGGVKVDGTCEIEVDFVLSCPGGYTLKDDVCAKIVEVGPQFYCPVGFYDDGNSCAKSIPGEATLQCDIGELVGDRCVLQQRTEHLIKSACPEGTELIDGNCWKEVETFDCTEPTQNPIAVIAAPKEHVPLGKKVLVSKGKTSRVRGLMGKELQVEEIPPPPPPTVLKPGKEMVAVSAPHPTMINVVSQVCSKKVQVDAIALVQCPPDYVDTGSHCLKEVTTQPIQICVSGEQKDGICIPMIKRTPKHPGCPKNAYMARGKCWKEEEVEPLKTCPASFTQIGEKCFGTVAEPGYECPVGLELVGDKCVGELVRAPLVLNVVQDVKTGKKY